jgi:ribosomal protein S18 acetylase RimI-like enzyme
VRLDVESIERATLDAVPPLHRQEWPGWIAALDPGTISRAASAVPLSHEAPVAFDTLVQRIESTYRARGLRPMLRVPRLPAWDAAREALVGRGYTAYKPTLLMAGDLDRLAATPPGEAVAVIGQPDDGWASVFLGEGFDPQDAESRIGILRRSVRSSFGRASVQGQVAAVGAIVVAGEWCGIHAMRTAPAFRGRGLAGQVMGALARHAAARGARHVFLQVEENNAPAQAAYARAGFVPGWTYDYWRAQATSASPISSS